MYHLINLEKTSDLLDIVGSFEAYDVIQLYKTSHPDFSHVIFTNTWHAKPHRLDVRMEVLNENVAAYMVNLAENTCVDMHTEDPFYDDTLIDLAYREFWSHEEDGILYGFDYWGERYTYYDPLAYKRPQFPEIGDTFVRRNVASLLKPQKKNPRKITITRKRAIPWME